MATVEELTIVAKVKDLATKVLKKINKEVRDFGTKASAAFNKARKAAGSFMSTAGKIAKPMTLAATAISAATALMGKGLSEAAADAEELSSKFDALFGTGAADARAWAENFRTAVGRGREETLEALAAMRGFTEGLGLAASEADALAMELTQLGVDLSSFYNVAQDDAMQRLRSGLIGNAEALDAFAARISETQLKEYAETNGIVYNSLTDTEKVLLRLEVLYGKVNKAVGDAERTSDSFQNRMRSLGGIIADARVKFGKFINEGVLRAIDTIGGPQGFTQLVDAALGTVASLSAALTNLAAQGLRGVVEGIERVGGAGNLFELTANRAEEIGIRAERGLDRVLSTLDAIGDSAVFKTLFGPVEYSAEKEQELIDAYRKAQQEMLEYQQLPIQDDDTLLDRLVGPRPRLEKALEDAANALKDYRAQFGDERREVAEANGRLGELLREREEILSRMFYGQPSPSDLPLPLIPEEPIGPMFGPTAPPEQQTSAVQAYTSAKQAAVVAERAHAQAIADQARAFAPLVAVGMQAASAVFGYYNERQAAFNEEQARLAAEAESWRKGNEEIGRRRELAANMFPTLQMGWMAAADAAQQYAVKVRETETAEAQMRSTANAIVSAFQLMVTQTENLSDALKSLAKSFAADLLGTQLRASIFPMLGLSAFAKGGVIPGGTGDAMPVKGYATGGPIMRSPHVALIGEGQYNEAVVPLPDGRSIPVQMQGGAGDGGSTSVEFTVNALDAASVADLFARNGKQLAEIVAGRFQRSRNIQASLGGGLV
jgi:hypothetical protein